MARRSRSTGQCGRPVRSLGELLHDHHLARRLTTRTTLEEAAEERRDEADYLAISADDDDLARQPPVLIEDGYGRASLYDVEENLLSDPKRLAEWQRIYQLAGQKKETPPIPDDAPAVLQEPTIYYHSDRGYSIDGRTPYVVPATEHRVLQVFLAKNTALTTGELEKYCDNPAKVIKGISLRGHKRFHAAVRCPGGKSAGGYYIRVRPAPDTKVG